jgi:DNA topoisomerase-6 subunit B
VESVLFKSLPPLRDRMPTKRTLAEELASRQRAISVAEFFERNRQILGFDNPQRSLLTTVKEATDNSLDACEEARTLPDILVEIHRLAEDRFLVAVEDNGPGILRREVPNVFGRLLYGSRFHANRQARGQQGIGISAAVLYAGLTTATPTHVLSKVEENPAAYEVDILLDTAKNQPRILREDARAWDRPHGTRVELTLKGRYQKGRQSPYEYLRGTAIVNPHARLTLLEPDGTRTTWERVSQELPPLPREIPPHPHGLELGELDQRLHQTRSTTLGQFLAEDLSGLSRRAVTEVLEKAGLGPRTAPGSISGEPVERLLAALKAVTLAPPSSDCLSPIGPLLIKRGLKNVLGTLRPEFYAPPVTRSPRVHAGCPFIVEVGLVYGGDLPSDQPIQLLRFANRVPLLFQQGACAITSTVSGIDWHRYGLEQKSGALPVGPMVLLVHVASTKIPYTSEAKEAVAETDEIAKEIGLAIQAAARSLKVHLSRSVRRSFAEEKFRIIQRILPRIAEKASAMARGPVPDLTRVITRIMDVVSVETQGGGAALDEAGPKGTLTLVNYTDRKRRLEVFLELPLEALGEGFRSSPEPLELQREMGRVSFPLAELSPNERLEIALEWPRGVRIDPDDIDVYVAGIDEGHLLGADPLPGDWEVRLPAALVEAAEAAETPGEELEEVDYDAAERKEPVASDED